MSEERTRRVGHNEALYRQVNERIEDLHETFATLTDDFAIVCECADLECMEQITVARELYERVRANPHHFILKPVHEAQDVEHPVERDGDYIVVEKHVGPATRISEETDPRS